MLLVHCLTPAEPSASSLSVIEPGPLKHDDLDAPCSLLPSQQHSYPLHHTSTMSDWDNLRRSVRNTENELDQRISSLSKLASQLSTGYYSSQSSASLTSSREDARRLGTEISEMLEKVGRPYSMHAQAMCRC